MQFKMLVIIIELSVMNSKKKSCLLLPWEKN